MKAFPDIFLHISQNLLEHCPESSWIFSGIFLSNPRNLLNYSPESFWELPRIFLNICQNLPSHFPESSWTFPGIFSNIPRNVKMITLNPSEHFPRSLHSPYSVLRSCIPGFINSLNFNYLTASYPFTIQNFFYPYFLCFP